jgi:hypothetical protein
MYCVPVDKLPVVFPKVVGLLTESFATHERDANPQDRVQELRQLLEQGLVNMWVLFDAAHENAYGVLVMGLVEYDRRRVLEIHSASVLRRSADWAEYLPFIRRYASAHGALAIEFDGRPGWSKVLAKHGFRTTQVRMVAEI